MKKIVLALLAVGSFAALKAQTVFTYGKNAVSKEEFLRAYNKNPSTATDRKKALKEYLELFINFKLKVQAAYDEGLQNDPTQQYELQNFKKQIADNIINEQANIGELVSEAFNRSQKDIHLAHVFVEVPAKADSAEAYNKIQSAYKALKEGKEFGRVAEEFSTDAAAKQSKGDLGFITVFTLPYEFENHAYSLKQGSYSAPVRTSIGYHIFKNMVERKPIGTRKVAQILFALPTNSSDGEKAASLKEADSVYNLIIKGASFSELASQISNDLSTSQNGGELAEFGVGAYSPDFEKVAFGLLKPGEISRPFLTSYGYHILKLIEARPVSTNATEIETVAFFRDRLQKDKRLLQAKKNLLKKQLVATKYKRAVFNEADLFAFIDSSLKKATPDPVKGISSNTVLFSFAKLNIKAGDFAKFAKAVRTAPNEFSGLDNKALLDQYVSVTASEYYVTHLEDYSKDFTNQVKEFKEANMLFGVMDKKIWTKANTDNIGLVDFYNKNKGKYTWNPSADAIIITAANDGIAEEVRKKLLVNVANWREITGSYNPQVTADSGRFELGQLPVVDRTNFTANLITAPVKNVTDGSLTFNYVIKVYSTADQRSFDDARGMVISDYQQVLEDRWLEQLKKKYAVKVNTAVFNTIK
ncbi:MAG: hypothetical protein JWQ96_2249 [Segetibacter sp.]|nr:hypothetical protein [Segetibacter sp.]